jgi:hypothetical protein
MRCPNCGSENAPDSRFCGVCGMQQTVPQVGAAQQRLAPTAKIPDDAPLAPPTRPVAAISPIAGVNYSPPSMPPQAAPGLAPAGQAGLTTRPGGHSAPPRVSTEQPVSRPIEQYGAPHRKPSREFDSATPTAQGKRQTPQPMPATAPPSDPRRAAIEDGPRRRPQVSSASVSFSAPAAHRPLGLIALVLFIDLGLAGAGAFLLAKGLEKPEKAPPTAIEKKTEAPGAPSAANANAATAVVSAEPIAPAPSAPTNAATTPPAATAATTTPTTATTAATAPTSAAARSTRASAQPTTTRAASTTPSTSASSSGPVTAPSGPVTSPSGATTDSPSAQPAAVQPPSTASEIEVLARSSAANFARCKGDAAVAGSIQIAFQVNPDGWLSGTAAIDNTTGNAELANCLVRVINGWRVSPFQGARMSFVRPFSYP